MKGIINTDNLLRAVLNKEHGILPKGNVLSHITVAQIPMYKKLLFFSDAAVIPRPTLEQFEAMLRYDLEVCRRMGIEAPRVALIHCTEKVNEKFPHTPENWHIATLFIRPRRPMPDCNISNYRNRHATEPLRERPYLATYLPCWRHQTMTPFLECISRLDIGKDQQIRMSHHRRADSFHLTAMRITCRLHIHGAEHQDLLAVQREEVRALPHFAVLIVAAFQHRDKVPVEAVLLWNSAAAPLPSSARQTVTAE